jgi:hypothetical protein
MEISRTVPDFWHLAAPKFGFYREYACFYASYPSYLLDLKKYRRQYIYSLKGRYRPLSA